MKKIGILICFLGVVSLAFTAGATTINIVNNFNPASGVQGTNGWYAYGYGNSILRSLTPFTNLTETGFRTDQNSPYPVPLVSERSYLGGTYLLLHPSALDRDAKITPYAEDAVLAWTIPLTTFYTVTGTFTLADVPAASPDPSADGVNWLIGSYNGGVYSLLTSGHLLANASSPFSLNNTLLNAGSQLFFSVSAGGNDHSDTTQLTGNINYNSENPVPEPATMLLLGSGLVGLAGFGRKKFFGRKTV